MAVLGQRESSREWARRAFAMRPTDSMLLYKFDYIYALLGFDDDALYAVEQAVHHGLQKRGWFEHDSNLDSVRAHPRFLALLGQLQPVGSAPLRNVSLSKSQLDLSFLSIIYGFDGRSCGLRRATK